MHRPWAAILRAGILAGLLLGLASAQAPGRLQDLHFRFIGPMGNRDISVVGVPGNPLVDYFGAASGGIWKTTDGGTTFRPIFDKEDVSAVGALAVAPSAPNIVWAGTGEPSIIRMDTAPGNGVYKSLDAGRTWRHMGLDDTGYVVDIATNPRDPQVVFVCAEGQVFRPNAQRGVFRTLDGGKTWNQVLRVNDVTGCSGLTMDAHDPETLFAGMWQVEGRPWNLNSGGPDSGVFVTHDGGGNWTRLSGHGLPAGGADLGKIAVRVAPSDPNRVYALIQERSDPGFYRSDDGGKTWTLENRNNRLVGRAPYFVNFQVSPADENLLYFVAQFWTISRDGGKSFTTHMPPASHDMHDVWIDPRDPNRLLVASDDGGAISLDGGHTYRKIVLPIAQIYHVYTDNRVPYDVMGNRQDTGAAEGPSRSLGGRGIESSQWHGYGGCESGFTVPDPVNANILWSDCYDGGLIRVDLKTGQVRNVEVWPEASYGWAPGKVRDRWNWTFPIAISPHNHNQVYVGSQYVYETLNGGQSWKRISPDLTLNDKSHERNSGGIVPDNLMTFDSETLSAIAESPVQAGVIWTGSYDGQVNVTRDGGKTWTNVTKNISGLPSYGDITRVEPSHFAPGTAYVSDSLMLMGDNNPYIYKTTDYGQIWTSISGDIPDSEFSYVHIIRQDPVDQNLLYAGTENALYFTVDGGQQWTQLKNNLPAAPVNWITIQPQRSDLVVATYGRGIWIADDITPLRSWAKVAQAGQPHLFKIRSTYRFRSSANIPEDNPNGTTVGQNPPYGTDINYYLPSAAKSATLTILGANGQTIRVLTATVHPGLNRVWWDLRYAPPATVRLLTPPPDKPWVKVGAQGWRPLVAWGMFGAYGGHAEGPRVVPGTYSVRLTVDGASGGTQPLTVLADPHTLGTQATMEAQKSFLLRLRSELNQTAALINQVERTRRQLANTAAQLDVDSGPQTVLAAARKLEASYLAVEDQLFDTHLSGASSEESFARGMRLYGRLANLEGDLDQTGADLGPTDQQIVVNLALLQQLHAARMTIESLNRTQGAAFDAMLHAQGMGLGIQFGSAAAQLTRDGRNRNGRGNRPRH